MATDDWSELLAQVAAAASRYRGGLATRRAGAASSQLELIQTLDPEQQLPRLGAAPLEVLAELLAVADPGLSAMGGPRFFGWVTGGALPAALAADWMCSAWDQNAGTASGTPAATAFETVALRWLCQAFQLPGDCVGALVSGATEANFVALAAARNHVLAAGGWDVEQQGLWGAPKVHCVVGHERHDTIDKAIRLLGFGKAAMVYVDTDSQGRMQAMSLRKKLSKVAGPVVVCAQAGNVNSGAFDPFEALADEVEHFRSSTRHPLWWHVDGAFGLWAQASPPLAALCRGVTRADSFTSDCHKLLNVPYDSGVVFTRHPIAHRRAMAISGAYLSSGDEASQPMPAAYGLGLSRRARGFAVWAALRTLGAQGIAQLIATRCELARHLAARLTALPGCEVLNDVVFNGVAVACFSQRDPDAAARTAALSVALQHEGTCYPTPTIWRGRPALRFSVTSWQTQLADIEATVAAVERLLGAYSGRG